MPKLQRFLLWFLVRKWLFCVSQTPESLVHVFLCVPLATALQMSGLRELYGGGLKASHTTTVELQPETCRALSHDVV